MPRGRFVHLHVHSEYSLLDGGIRIKDLVNKVLSLDMRAVALTDHGNMFGAVEFYETAIKAGVKPIVGCEVYVAPGSREARDGVRARDAAHHLLLLAENETGYRNLLKLVTEAYLTGFYYRPRVDKELLASHCAGLIALSACLHGEIPQALLAGDVKKARDAAGFYSGIFEKSFYLEVQAGGTPEQELVNRELVKLSKEMSLPLVATNDCHYLEEAHLKAHDTLVCIQTGKTLDDKDRMRMTESSLHLKSPEEMAEYFADLPEAIENTLEVAERCNLELELGTTHFPVFPTNEGFTQEEKLKDDATRGLEARLEAIRAKRGKLTKKDEKVYQKRLDFELDVILKMGFASYFLIVADFIQYARDNGVPVGPGRGSAAGSLVAYSLGITDLDPIEHSLIFERFLNVERKSLPDIDVDFCAQGRDKVIKYVAEKYGRDRVAQIITFGSMKARAVIRDVGRALAMPYAEVDQIAKLVPNILNISLRDALDKEPRLKAKAEEETRVAELMEIAFTLEGLSRNSSTHAGGVVIADRPLTDYLPLATGPEGETITQYSMKWVERVGLIKFDLLGLRNLTIIADTLKLIRETRGIDLKIEEIPEGDHKTFELLQRGDTTGVFQLEGRGMRELMVRLKPESFGDVVALVALFRPGPLGSGMVDDFIKAKRGKIPVRYEVPELEPILKETYGVILYQEQVMQIASLLAAYSLGEADILRRAMGKKVLEVMAQQRDRFLEGAKKKKVPAKKAEKIFDLMANFAEYGFNKSHSAAYALIAYQTAYLKSHFPVEFMAAVLTSEMNNTDKLVRHISEFREQEITILPPDVNLSARGFTVEGDGIRFGLNAVKNVGQAAIETIIESREEEEGPFTSIFDFTTRVDLRRVNRRVVESLIKCGGFDSLGARRSQLMEVLEEALEIGQAIQRERDKGQISLFEGTDMVEGFTRALPELDEWSESELLSNEKEALGFFISGHPLARYTEKIALFTDLDTSRLSEAPESSRVTLGGVVGGLKETTTKNGDRMAFFTLEDLFGQVEVIVFPKVFKEVAAKLASDRPILVTGRLERDENGHKVLAREVVTLKEAHLKLARSVHLRLSTTALTPDDLARLKRLLASHPGDCPTYLHLLLPKNVEAVISLPRREWVTPSPELKEEVDSLFGLPVVTVSYRES